MNSDKSGVCPQLNNVTDKSRKWVDIDRRSTSCFWFSSVKNSLTGGGVQTRSKASSLCRQRNGALISIHSKHDLMLLKTKLTKDRYFNTWIGLSTDHYSE